jgi:hypothetical protein
MIIDSSELKVFRNPFKLEEGQILNLRFGPLNAFLGHFAQEWRVSWTSTNDYMDNSFKIDVPFQESVPEELQSQIRYTYSRPSNAYIKVTPVLGDRPFVAKPTKPLMVLPGETVKIYMSIPLFLRIESEEPYHLIEEIPVLKSPKTWFGESTTAGEVCYSTRIKAVLDKKELVNRPYRAVSQLIIENRGADALHVEKLKVPAPFLSLFQRDDGIFFTSVIHYIREVSGEIKTIDIISSEEGDDLYFLAGPRLRPDASFLNPLSYFFGRYE